MRKSKARVTKKRKTAPKPAPGQFQILLEFLNTIDRRSETEGLNTARDLGTWLTKWGLLPGDTELTEADVRRARTVRTGLRHLAAGHSGGKADPKAIQALVEATAGVGPRLHFDRDGSTRMELLARTFEEALGSLIGLVHIAQLEGVWPRFKICLDQDCSTTYYDYATNRVSKWCTTRCGDRNRARAYRKGMRYRERRLYG